jgi:DNA repair protein RecO (recombination protein O)
MEYFQRETRELVSLDSCELIQSQFGLVASYEAGVALDYFAEVAEQMLPAGEANERFFRLLLAVLESMREDGAAAVSRAVIYFSLWAVRLSGWLPDLRVCLGCGSVLDDPEHPERAFFSRGQAGLTCAGCRRALGGGNSWELTAAARALAAEILRRPVGQIPVAPAPDLRRFLVQQIESHVERRLITAPLLES